MTKNCDFPVGESVAPRLLIRFFYSLEDVFYFCIFFIDFAINIENNSNIMYYINRCLCIINNYYIQLLNTMCKYMHTGEFCL